MPDGRAAAWIGLIASVISIYVFITGVQSIKATLEQFFGAPINPAYTPEANQRSNIGEKFIFASIQNDAHDIYSMTTTDRNLTRLTKSKKLDENEIETNVFPSVSPDGKRIAYTYDTAERTEIRVMDFDGKNQGILFASSGRVGMPAWSGDGKLLAFVSDRDFPISENAPPVPSCIDGSGKCASWEIYIYNIETNQQFRLTTNSATDMSPQWSPDSKFIVFSSDRDGNSEIYMMRSDGTEQTRLTNNSTSDLYPTWSPNSNKVAYQSKHGSSFSIYTIDIEARKVVQLTNRNDWFPVWSPNGEKIAFVSNRDQNLDEFNNCIQTKAKEHGISIDVEATSFKDLKEPALYLSFGLMCGHWSIFVMNPDGTNQIRFSQDNNFVSWGLIWSRN